MGFQICCLIAIFQSTHLSVILLFAFQSHVHIFSLNFDDRNLAMFLINCKFTFVALPYKKITLICWNFEVFLSFSFWLNRFCWCCWLCAVKSIDAGNRQPIISFDKSILSMTTVYSPFVLFTWIEWPTNTFSFHSIRFIFVIVESALKVIRERSSMEFINV